MRTVEELHDTATAYYIRRLGGAEKFKGYLDIMRHYGEITENERVKLVGAVDRAFEREGCEEQREGQTPATVTDKGKSQNFTAKEVGERIGCSANTVYRMVKKNEIPYKANGRNVRFDADDLDKWMGSGAFRKWQRNFTPKRKRETRDISEMRKDENGVEHKVYLANPLKAYRRKEAAALLGITRKHLDVLARKEKIRRRKDVLGSYFWGDDLIKYRERHPRRGGKGRKSPSLFEN